MAVDRYADGRTISARRSDKARVIEEALRALLPEMREGVIVDFGSADGAVPVQLLNLVADGRIGRIIGITLLDYNDLAEKPAHGHPRYTRLVGDLSGPLDGLDLPWGRCDAVTATGFFHYLAAPEVAFGHAYRLLRPGGYLLAGMPARWVLRLRRRGCGPWLPPNNYIRTVVSLGEWARLAASCGFVEVSCRAVQWLGQGWSVPVERCLRRVPVIDRWGTHYLAVYRKPLTGASGTA